jgi:anti-sigma B factor antagonist
MADMDRIDVDNVTILKLKGSFMLDDVEQMEKPFEAVTHRPGARVVVDLTHVDMVTTPALSMFIAAANEARHNGGTIIFTESSPPVRDVLKRLRLSAVLRTVPGLDEAISQARA